MRLIDPDAPFEPKGKIAECVLRCYTHYVDTMKQKGVQLVFCDTSVPHKDGFDVYNEFRRQAVLLGIPEEEIAFIHSAKNNQEKEALFGRCRSGEIRILLGSTQKCGAGTNVQERLVALHHLDCPYRPSDVEQREGRILRQGNLFFDEVFIYRYVTEKSFDAYLWSIVETKARFIAQVVSSAKGARTCEDMDDAVLCYAEVKAIASGDPRIKEKLSVDSEVSRLLLLQSDYERQRHHLQDEVQQGIPRQIREAEERARRIEQDIKTLAEHPMPEFQMELGGRIYTKREDAGKMLHLAATPVKNFDEIAVGHYRGFRLKLYHGMMDDFRVKICGRQEYTVDLSQDDLGAVIRIDNQLKGLDDLLATTRNGIVGLQEDLRKTKETLARPFEFEDQLKEMIARQTELNVELDLDKRGEELTDTEEGEEDMMTVVLVEPGAPARIEKTRGELKDMQDMVGGSIAAVRPFDDNAVLVCNKEGKLLGLPPNRRIGADVIAGSFFICASTEDDFTSLDRRQLEKYRAMFETPDEFDLTGAYDVEPIGC